MNERRLCPYCRQALFEQEEFCPACARREDIIPKCSRCGKELLPGALRCNACGIDLSVRSGTASECPACKRRIKRGATKCNWCGLTLADFQIPTRVAPGEPSPGSLTDELLSQAEKPAPGTYHTRRWPAELIANFNRILVPGWTYFGTWLHATQCTSCHVVMPELPDKNRYLAVRCALVEGIVLTQAGGESLVKALRRAGRHFGHDTLNLELPVLPVEALEYVERVRRGQGFVFESDLLQDIFKASAFEDIAQLIEEISVRRCPRCRSALCPNCGADAIDPEAGCLQCRGTRADRPHENR